MSNLYNHRETMNNIFKIIAISAITCSVASCEQERFEGFVKGTAVAVPSSFRNGDEVTVQLGRNISIQTVIISGTEYPPMLHYEIDGKEVATSKDSESLFAAKFVAEGLQPGEHTLSVSAPTVWANIDYDIKISSSTVTVLE